jgi:hypothetical protein
MHGARDSKPLSQMLWINKKESLAIYNARHHSMPDGKVASHFLKIDGEEVTRPALEYSSRNCLRSLTLKLLFFSHPTVYLD